MQKGTLGQGTGLNHPSGSAPPFSCATSVFQLLHRQDIRLGWAVQSGSGSVYLPAPGGANPGDSSLMNEGLIVYITTDGEEASGSQQS